MTRGKFVPLLLVPLPLFSLLAHAAVALEPVLPPLVFPSGGTIKLLFGYATPISMPGRIMSYNQNFQFQFSLPQNVTLFREYFESLGAAGRRRRRQTANMISERSIFYRHLELELQRRGGASERDCLKRSVCEYAETPLRVAAAADGEEQEEQEEPGLVGEVLHVLLTPEPYGHEVDNEFSEAARVGRGGRDCAEAYPSCPKGFGILDHISKLIRD